MSNQPTAARQAFGHIAPALAELTDTVLFGDVWQRPGLGSRERCLITVACAIPNQRAAISPEKSAGKRHQPR